MAQLKCKRCKVVLDPDPEFCHAVLEDGTKLARCPNCDIPYKVPKGKGEPEPAPPPEPPPAPPEE